MALSLGLLRVPPLAASRRTRFAAKRGWLYWLGELVATSASLGQLGIPSACLGVDSACPNQVDTNASCAHVAQLSTAPAKLEVTTRHTGRRLGISRISWIFEYASHTAPHSQGQGAVREEAGAQQAARELQKLQKLQNPGPGVKNLLDSLRLILTAPL